MVWWKHSAQKRAFSQRVRNVEITPREKSQAWLLLTGQLWVVHILHHVKYFRWAVKMGMIPWNGSHYCMFVLVSSISRSFVVVVRASALVTCVESGLIRVWKEGSTDTVSVLHPYCETANWIYVLFLWMLCGLTAFCWLSYGQVEINAGSGVCRMRQNKSQRTRVATGGKENPLKVWDLERPEKAVFTAKNVSAPHTETLSRHGTLVSVNCWCWLILSWCSVCVDLVGRWKMTGWTCECQFGSEIWPSSQTQRKLLHAQGIIRYVKSIANSCF